MNMKTITTNPYINSFHRVDVYVLKDLKDVLDCINVEDLDEKTKKMYKDFDYELTLEIEANMKE